MRTTKRKNRCVQATNGARTEMGYVTQRLHGDSPLAIIQGAHQRFCMASSCGPMAVTLNDDHRTSPRPSRDSGCGEAAARPEDRGNDARWDGGWASGAGLRVVVGGRHGGPPSSSGSRVADRRPRHQSRHEGGVVRPGGGGGGRMRRVVRGRWGSRRGYHTTIKRRAPENT